MDASPWQPVCTQEHHATTCGRSRRDFPNGEEVLLASPAHLVANEWLEGIRKTELAGTARAATKCSRSASSRYAGDIPRE